VSTVGQSMQRLRDPGDGSPTSDGVGGSTAVGQGADPKPRTRAPGPLPLGPAERTRQAVALRRRLLALLPPRLTVEVTITSNKTVMISAHRDPRRRCYRLRLHHLFVACPDSVVGLLARYLVHNDQAASRELGAFVERLRPGKAAPGPRSSGHATRTRGKVHDLKAYYTEINARYFGDGVQCKLSWGRHAARGRARRAVNVGSYTLEDNIIRIHPGLDQEWVPAFYVKWVLYHEMLHASEPVERVGGRNRFHTAGFRALETQFHDHDRAVAWERKNLASLLRI